MLLISRWVAVSMGCVVALSGCVVVQPGSSDGRPHHHPQPVSSGSNVLIVPTPAPGPTVPAAPTQPGDSSPSGREQRREERREDRREERRDDRRDERRIDRIVDRRVDRRVERRIEQREERRDERKSDKSDKKAAKPSTDSTATPPQPASH